MFRLVVVVAVVVVLFHSIVCCINYNVHFPRMFMPEVGQEAVFEDTNNLIQSAVDGFNVCIFAYGQTGSGKTYTMIGDRELKSPGIAPRAFQRIFEVLLGCVTVCMFICNLHTVGRWIDLTRIYLDYVFSYDSIQVIEENSKKFEFNVSVYMLELYNEKLLDLLIDSATGTSGEGRYDIKKDKKGMGEFLGRRMARVNIMNE